MTIQESKTKVVMRSVLGRSMAEVVRECLELCDRVSGVGYLRTAGVRKEPRASGAAIIVDVGLDSPHWLRQRSQIQGEPRRIKPYIAGLDAKTAVPATAVLRRDGGREAEYDILVGPCLIAVKLR